MEKWRLVFSKLLFFHQFPPHKLQISKFFDLKGSLFCHYCVVLRCGIKNHLKEKLSRKKQIIFMESELWVYNAIKSSFWVFFRWIIKKEPFLLKKCGKSHISQIFLPKIDSKVPLAQEQNSYKFVLHLDQHCISLCYSYIHMLHIKILLDISYMVLIKSVFPKKISNQDCNAVW